MANEWSKQPQKMTEKHRQVKRLGIDPRALCYHGFSETPADCSTCDTCVRIKELDLALDGFVGMYIANRGRRDAEFIRCITPGSRKDKGSAKYWNAWDKARRLLGENV